MTEFVRVKDLDTRHHLTLPRHLADASDRLQILEGHPALDTFGRPLPAKPCTNNKSPRAELEPTPDVSGLTAEEDTATEPAGTNAMA